MGGSFSASRTSGEHSLSLDSTLTKQPSFGGSLAFGEPKMITATPERTP